MDAVGLTAALAFRSVVSRPPAVPRAAGETEKSPRFLISME